MTMLSRSDRHRHARLSRSRRRSRRRCPAWLVSLATLAFANALVVLGLIILWRAGLVPFGQALFYAIGAYAVALIARYTPVARRLRVDRRGRGACLPRRLPRRFLLARYREIFFSMLSLAMSMILYGVLVKTETLGSTDGFHVEPATYSRLRAAGRDAPDLALYWLVLGFWRRRGIARLALFPLRRRRARGSGARQRNPPGVSRRLGQPADPSQARDCRRRSPASAARLAALSIDHVDPNMAYWTTSGGFVFVTILAGAGSVAAAFVGSFVFELVTRSLTTSCPAPGRSCLGAALLLTILFLPEGLGSLLARLRRRPNPKA